MSAVEAEVVAVPPPAPESASGDAPPQTPEQIAAAAAAAAHNSSLYVGDLDREVSEAQLFDVFSQIGPVASIRVCRDAVTRRSLGYAYVNFNSTLDSQAAERALDALNYQPLNGKPMRIMWSHRDPAVRRSNVGNIFIKNLDRSIDNKALHDTFTAFGNILSSKVALDITGQSKGYAFVHYELDEAANLAIEKVNGMLLEGKKVFVGPFLNRTDRPAEGLERFTNVFVKNLPETTTEDELRTMFGEHGEVTSVVLMMDDEGASKGFGFVNFEDADAAQRAVENINDKEIDGKAVFAGRAQKKSEREASLKAKFDDIRQERVAKYQGMNLYIKNLADTIDDDKLRAEFEPFGTITSAKCMKDGGEKSKGFGFVCFASPEEATRAVTEMNGKMLDGKPMYVALAQRKEMRKVQLEQQYNQRLPLVPAGGRGPGPMPGMYPPAGAQPMYFQPGPMGGRGMPNGAPAPYGYPPMMGGRGAPSFRGRGAGRGPRPDFGMMAGPGGYPGAMGGFPGRGPAGPRGRGPRGPGREGFGGRGEMDFGGRGGRGGPGRGMEAGPYSGRGGAGAGRGRGPMGSAPPPPGALATPSAVVPGQDGAGLTTAMLAAADPGQQKQMLGERLFPQVQTLQPELAGKITGMLLEMDNSELLLLLESPEALDSKVDEAIQVLKQHNAM